MNEDQRGTKLLNRRGFTRREFISAGLGGVALAAAGLYLWPKIFRRKWREPAFIAKVPNYQRRYCRGNRGGLQRIGGLPRGNQG